ncbi:MAG: AEC family transporter [Christensenellales bacterium]
MDKLYGVLQTVLPVLLMIAAGVLLKKKKIVNKEGIAGLKKFIFYITIPVMAFKAFYNATYGTDIIVITIVMFAACIILLCLGFVFKRVTRSPMHTTPFLMTGFEAGMLGFALYPLLFGADKLTYFATVDLGQELFVFIIFMTLLLSRDSKHGVVLGALKRMVTTPLIVSVFAGVIIGATGLGNLIYTSAAGETVQYVLEFISAPTAAIILFVVGFELELKGLNFKSVISLILTRVIFVGAICLALLSVFSAFGIVNAYIRWAVILLFILPPPMVIPILLDNEKENAYVSATLSAYTILSLIAFAIMSYSVA